MLGQPGGGRVKLVEVVSRRESSMKAGRHSGSQEDPSSSRKVGAGASWAVVMFANVWSLDDRCRKAIYRRPNLEKRRKFV
jgi:hypothetical protein